MAEHMRRKRLPVIRQAVCDLSLVIAAAAADLASILLLFGGLLVFLWQAFVWQDIPGAVIGTVACFIPSFALTKLRDQLENTEEHPLRNILTLAAGLGSYAVIVALTVVAGCGDGRELRTTPAPAVSIDTTSTTRGTLPALELPTSSPTSTLIDDRCPDGC